MAIAFQPNSNCRVLQPKFQTPSGRVATSEVAYRHSGRDKTISVSRNAHEVKTWVLLAGLAKVLMKQEVGFPIYGIDADDTAMIAADLRGKFYGPDLFSRRQGSGKPARPENPVLRSSSHNGARPLPGPAHQPEQKKTFGGNDEPYR
ncbi:hypothetical protein [Rhizobium sp. Root483D2]|uniref:hypothetical protein n=1 Tax=Rhizobium sp. Root483D2 TaxID=1736545 RepID=UPI0012E34D44|nr:hypothetical protein [Rhizobium sp. Root483D2]